MKEPKIGVPPLDTQKTNNTGGNPPPPPPPGAQKTKPEHPKRILQTNVKENERQPSISGTKEGEKT